MPTFSGFQNASTLSCPFKDLQYTGEREEYSFTDTSFTATSFMEGISGTLPVYTSSGLDIDGNPIYLHTMKKIVYGGTGKPADEFGNDLDVFVCVTCGYRMLFYGSTSRTTLGI